MIPIPILSRIDVIGSVFFNQNILNIYNVFNYSSCIFCSLQSIPYKKKNGANPYKRVEEAFTTFTGIATGVAGVL